MVVCMSYAYNLALIEDMKLQERIPADKNRPLANRVCFKMKKFEHVGVGPSTIRSKLTKFEHVWAGGPSTVRSPSPRDPCTGRFHVQEGGVGPESMYHRSDPIQGTDYIANYFFLNLRVSRAKIENPK